MVGPLSAASGVAPRVMCVIFGPALEFPEVAAVAGTAVAALSASAEQAAEATAALRIPLRFLRLAE
jgi:hypothetical protein